MKKILVLVIVALLGVGGYMLLNRKTDEVRCEAGFRFVPSSQKCEPVEVPKGNNIDFSKVQIQISGGNEKISFQKEGDTTKYSGVVEIEMGKDSKTGDLPKTKVYASFDSKDALKYSDELMLIPFLYNAGGTGQFVSLGLFDIASNNQLDSVSIGDRIAIDSIQVVKEKIKVNFKDRLFAESFVVEPTIPTQLVFGVQDKKLIPVLKLQNADYDDVEIKSPQTNAQITDTLDIKGAIPGSWYFEGNAQLRILDGAYNEIAISSIQARSDWMTTQRVPFESTFSVPSLNYKGNATIIIQSENVKGDEDGERMVKKIYIPVQIK